MHDTNVYIQNGICPSELSCKVCKNKPGNASDKQTNITEVVSGMPLKSEKATRKPAPFNLLAKPKAKVSVLQVCVSNGVCTRMCFSVHEVQSAVPGFLAPH